MSTALKLQKNLLKEITKDFENFVKRSVKERSKNYITNIITTLETNFAASTKNNIDGISSCEEPVQEEALEEVFGKINEIYLDYKTALLDSLERVDPPAEQPVLQCTFTWSQNTTQHFSEIQLHIQYDTRTNVLYPRRKLNVNTNRVPSMDERSIEAWANGAFPTTQITHAIAEPISAEPIIINPKQNT